MFKDWQAIFHAQGMKIILVLITLAFVVPQIFVLLNYHYHIITCPYPQDYNESSNILPTYDLLQGINPFDINDNPQHMQTYGIIYPLLMWPIAKIWGCTLVVHRMVVAFCLLMALGVVVAVLRKNRCSGLMSFLAAGMLYPFFIYPSTTTEFAMPNGLGLLFFLLSVFLPPLYDYSRRSLLMSIIAVILAFYTKPYFLLGGVITGSYLLLFRSKKEGFWYGTVFCILFVLAAYVADHFMNCYFNNVIFSLFNYPLTMSSPTHSMVEMMNFYQIQKPLFWLYAFAVLVWFVIFTRIVAWDHVKKIPQRINLFGWREPFIQWDMGIILWGLIVSTLFVYCLLGRNLGQLYEYSLQLMSPFFIMVIFNYLGQRPWGVWLALPFVIMALYALTASFPKDFHRYEKNWEGVDQLLASNPDVFTDPLLTSILLKYNHTVYISSTSEAFVMGAKRSIMHLPLKDDVRVQQRNADYLREVWLMTAERKFDFLIMYPNMHACMSSMFEFFYQQVGSVDLGTIDSTYIYHFIVYAPRPTVNLPPSLQVMMMGD